MRHDFLDRYSRLKSPVHRWPAGLKMALSLLIVFTTVLSPIRAWGWFAAIGVVLAMLAMISGIPWTFLAKRLLLLEPAVLGVALLTIFQPGGVVIFTGIVVKSTICLSTMILLSSTTPFSELLQVLRRLRGPELLITTLALMYRYLFVLADEADRMHRARAGRTFDRRRWHGWRSLATVISQLFVRSTERAERIYAAMLARGWK
jgi:cobalt/nickel transport system permease protein